MKNEHSKHPKIISRFELLSDQTNPFTCRYEYTDYPIMHMHDHWEFTVVTKGKFSHHINGTTENLKRGDFRLLRPNDFHMLMKTSEVAEHINFIVPDSVMKTQLNIFGNNLYEDLVSRQFPLATSLSEHATQKYVSHTMNVLSTPVEDSQYYLLQAQLFNVFVQDLLKCLFSAYPPKGRDMPEVVLAMMREIRNPENARKNLEEIVSSSGYSYVHLIRLFKESLNMTPSEYLIASRMHTAKLYLENTDKTVLEISSLSGYSSLSHFNKTFRNHFKVTPSQYRRRWRKLYGEIE